LRWRNYKPSHLMGDVRLLTLLQMAMGEVKGVA
jgi:hypothetical protein